MSNNQTPAQDAASEDPPDPVTLLSPDEFAEAQAQLTIAKTKLEISKLEHEVKDLPFEPARKWFTLTLALFGVIIAAYGAFKKAPEAPVSPGVSHECSVPLAPSKPAPEPLPPGKPGTSARGLSA